MPATSPDEPDRAAEARALRNAGKSVDAIAEQFGVHRATVYNWFKRGEREPGETGLALEELLSGVELDAEGKFNAAVARVLAAKLDESKNSPIAAVAMAAPSIAKELRTVVESIMGATTDAQEWVTDLFS